MHRRGPLILILGVSTIVAILVYVATLNHLVPNQATQTNKSKPVLTLESRIAASATTDGVGLIDFSASVKDLIINIGSNLDPIMPHSSLGPCARTLAVEPIVGCKIPSHPQLDVLHAAVAGSSGISTMKIFNQAGVSSSLSKPSSRQFWNSNAKRGDGQRVIVPRVSMVSLLNSIPDNVSIRFLMTDMQGFDFVAVSSAGPELVAKVPMLRTEVWKDDAMTYEAYNDLCRDWLPFMTKLGYELQDGACGKSKQKILKECGAQLKQKPKRPPLAASAGLKECNADWVLESHAKSTERTQTVPFKQAARFSDEEYHQCQ